MTIEQLINEAKEKDHKFKRQIEHRIHKRCKVPELDWVMTNLERILGKDYVQDAARKYIESVQNEAKNDEEIG